MQITPLKIDGVFLLEPKVFEDDRGCFFESYNQKVFEDATGISPAFVQDNHSKSIRGVLRGLHYQLPPMAQGKLIRVIQGKIFDVAVDLRSDSSTFGMWVSEILSSKNRKQLWIPEGFAHGFVSMIAGTEVLYKTTQNYSAKYEASIRWDDSDLAIDWPLKNELKLSERDASTGSFEEVKQSLPQGDWRCVDA